LRKLYLLIPFLFLLYIPAAYSDYPIALNIPPSFYYAPCFQPLKNTTNSWYGSWATQGTPTTLSITNNTIYATPFCVGRTITIHQIESEVVLAGQRSDCRMGIYNDTGNGYPEKLISGSDVSSANTDSVGIITKTFAQDKLLLDGLYWLAMDCNAGQTSSIILDSSNYTQGKSSMTENAKITVGANNNRILLAVLHLNSNVGTITSVKIGATSLTRAVQSGGAGTGMDIEFWYLTQSAGLGTGSQTVTVTNNIKMETDVGLVSLYNVNQTAPIGVTVVRAGNIGPTTNPTLTITPTTIGSWIFGAISDGQTISNPNQTAIYTNASRGDGVATNGLQYNPAPVIANPNGLSWTANIANWGGAAIELRHFPIQIITPTFRAIPQSSIMPFLGMPNTMGVTNGGTMYEGNFTMSSTLTPLPNNYPSSANITTIQVPEILVDVVK